VTISADGETFAYLGEDSGQTWQIWVRHRNQLEATPVPGTTSATDPVLSPDGREVAFTTGGPGPLKVVTLATGGVRTVADSARWRGLAWGDDGLLYFVTAGGGLARVPPDGGDAEVLTTPVAGTSHWNPHVLPGAGGAVLKIVTGMEDEAKLAAVDFARGEVEELGPSGSNPVYLPTGDLAWTSSSDDVWTGWWQTARISAHLAVSASGTLLYRRGDNRTLVTPVWVARDGTSEAVAYGWEVPVVKGSMGIALSPDGSRFVMPILGPTSVDLWVRDLSGTLSRLTFEGNSARPQWSPDGEDVAFVSDKLKTLRDAIVKRADGSSASRLALTSDRQVDEVTYSHDGEWLVYRLGTGADRDIYAARSEGDSVGTPLVAMEYEERSATISPDDRWMAYVSNENGPNEVFVVPFPDAGASKWQVSTDGGTEPVWSRDGRELFYRDANDNLVAAEITGASSFVVGRKRVLFSARRYAADANHTNYDVDPDGRRFLMLEITSTGGGELILVDHWFTELRALLKKQ
jgi:Tol biopolymer transport system component